MSYSNRILGWSGEVASSETVIVKGGKGDLGIGFKLTSDGNYNLQNTCKKVFNLDTPDDHKVDDDYDIRVRDLKSAVNKEYLNDKFLKKDENGNYFDLKGSVIKNSEPYYDGLHDDNDLVPKKYVDTENGKQNIAIMLIKPARLNVDAENGKQKIAIADKTNKSYVDNADTALLNNINGTKQALSELLDKVEQVDNKKLNIHGGNSMTVDLDMGNNKIISLSTDSHNVLSATNVMYINQIKGAMITTLTDSFTKKINESHITSSDSKKDVFPYIMEDVNESLSESNIIVDGIMDFPASHHDVNKKAHSFKMGKGAQNWYSSRLGFNVFVLPNGEYTLVVKFFPPVMDKVTVSVISPQLNISQHSTKLLSTYSRSTVNMHKYSSTDPQRIFVNIRCQGIAGSWLFDCLWNRGKTE